jgi:spore coat protein H
MHEHSPPCWLVLLALLSACPTTPPEEVCGDGVDNDGDGDLDCADVDCTWECAPPGDDDDAVDDDDSSVQPDDDDATPFPWPGVRLNEFMTDNRSTAQDASGTWADWVELYNPEGEAIALDGWLLSDAIGDPADGHPLDGLSIEADGFLLLWADGDTSEGPDHLGFRLASSGEELCLFAPDETVIDALVFGQQAGDVSTARGFDGGGDWGLVVGGTPGAANGGAGDDDDDDDDDRPGFDWPGPGPACELVQAGLASPWFTEGDAVGFSVDCSGELTSEQASIEPLLVPDEIAFDSSTLSVDWQTGPASGGRIDMVFEIGSDLGEVPHAGTVSVWVTDDPSAPDNVPVEPASYLEEWGLPVFHVLPEGELSQEYVDADLWYGGHHYESGIKIRGAASVGYPKNSFTLRFDGAELPVPQWGVTRDRMVLVTTFDDNSYVRQKLVFDQWAAMAEYWGGARLVPRSYFAVLYLDGAYHGLYMAVDHVDDEFVGQMGFDDSGNLYKSVNHDANFGPLMANGSDKTNLHAGWEKKEGEPEDDFSDLDALVAFTSAVEAEELIAGIDDWIDLQEFMDWFLLVHYSVSADSAGKNAYLYADPDGSGFRYVPWDFNHSWGQNWRTFRVASDSLPSYEWNNRVFWAIQQVDAAEAEMWERFSLMREDGPYSAIWIDAKLDEYYAQIQPSAERDWAMWSDAYYSYSWASTREAAGDWTDLEGEKDFLYNWLDERDALFWANHPD